MDAIRLLNDETINKIAAGEVVEKPLNVVKELVENSIDAGASAITVDIKGGGIELIRVTDNGKGINESQCTNAFLRHATSKISSIEDLEALYSLGFRGEALSSISAVSKLEMITKTGDSLLGTRVVVEGGKLLEKSEVGAPNGTTMIIRSLFYNTPARKKFLKSATTEASLIQDIVEKFALSHPEIAFQLIINGKTKISTSGNGNLKDVIFHIFGRDVYNSLLEVSYDELGVKIQGFTAKPEFSYQARNGEIYFINGRFIKSKIIKTAIEEVYRKYLMQHRFPFCILLIDVLPSTVDVNVHPQKLEVKFSDNSVLVDAVINSLNQAFEHKELIPEVTISDREYSLPIAEDNTFIPKEKSLVIEKECVDTKNEEVKPVPETDNFVGNKSDIPNRLPDVFETNRRKEVRYEKPVEIVEEDLFKKHLISEESAKEYHIVGQVFDTYWIIELDDEMYIVDQHAAHEKVNYERFLKKYNDGTLGGTAQMLMPALSIHLSTVEANAVIENIEVFNNFGFDIEDFGMGSIVLRSIPENLFGIDAEEMFHRLLDELLSKDGSFTPTFISEKLASLSCKAAIKGGQRISAREMEGLMRQLMELENPYNCPHGRPVFVKISKNEMEKKFKRIV